MLEIEEQPDVITVAFSHGKVNALDTALLRAVEKTFREVADDHRSVVLTGHGSTFSAGVDLRQLVDGGETYVREFLPALSDAFLAVFAHPGPVVAAVNGHALAGGCIFMAACDVRIAADGPALLGVTEVVVGVPFPTTPLEIIRHAVGDAVASHLVFTGRRVDVAEARRIGLVHEVVPPDELAAVARARASELGGRPRAPYVLAKQQLRRTPLERIAADRAQRDPAVEEIWASPQTAASVRSYLASLREQRA